MTAILFQHRTARRAFQQLRVSDLLRLQQFYSEQHTASLKADGIQGSRAGWASTSCIGRARLSVSLLCCCFSMADSESKKSKTSSFLKKSKWGRVLKERDSTDEDSATGQHAPFQLNSDVADFLKPSTEKTKPKLDIALAKRWPDAHEVRRAGEASPLPDRTFTKPKRRKGLTVTFAKTVPDIIGEGGDEAPDPPSEIGRLKAMVSRSSSDRRGPPVNSDWTRSPPVTTSHPARDPPPLTEANNEPPPIRRAQSSPYESSPAVQRKHASPPDSAVEPHKPSLGRKPTGFDRLVPVPAPHVPAHGLIPGTNERGQGVGRPQPAPINTHVRDREQEHGQNLAAPTLSASSQSGLDSPVVIKRREMSNSEGMMFRRASMMIQNEDDEDSPEISPEFKTHLHVSLPQQYPKVTVPDQPSPSQSNFSPQTASTTDAPNPFADPKYIESHSRDYRPTSHQTGPQREENFAGAVQGEFAESSRSATSSASHMALPSVAGARDRSRSPGLPNRFFQPPVGPGQPPTVVARPNGSPTAPNFSVPTGPHSRQSSRDNRPVQESQPLRTGWEQSTAHHSAGPATESSQSPSPRSSLLGQGRPSPSSRFQAPSPNLRVSQEDSFAATKAPQGHTVKSPYANLRHDNTLRPGSAGSDYSYGRSSSSTHPPADSDPAADAAYADFAARVAHMKGVLRLTAERERPTDRCTPSMWLRAGLWWYLAGKSGLEMLLQRRHSGDQRELLTQAHVDLAKAWWILSDPLGKYDAANNSGEHTKSGDPSESYMIMQGASALKRHLETLARSMTGNRLLPPEQSMIQGQNTNIWMEYPQFTSDAAGALSGQISKSILVEESRHTIDAYQMLPLSDSRDSFCYGRFPVEVSLHTDEVETDRAVLPCMMTVLRDRRDFQTSIAIASQSELVSLKISPTQDERRGLTWSDVSWNANRPGLSIQLPRNFDVDVRMQERDFRAVWNLSEHARKVEKTLHPEEGEKLVHDARLAELQYADSSNAHAFPPDKIRGCTALVFERQKHHVDGDGMHKTHQGFRLLLTTDPGHKTLSAVSHDVGQRAPFYFEFITDAAAHGTTAMVIRIREERRQCRILLVFPNAASRQALYDVLNGLNVGPDETIVGKANLSALSIEPAAQFPGFSQSAQPALASLQWQRLGVTNSVPDDSSTRMPSTVQSEHLRIVARHSTGCITDRVNVGKGELLLRLPAVDSPSIQILRAAQEDMTMSIDTRHAPQQVAEGIGQLLHTVLHQPTIRTFTFVSHTDLHTFQSSITGCAVGYDGLASTFGISRRRMVVPIYKKWEAANVRLQIVSKGSIVQLLAFMEEFSHADALCFQIKSTDTFEAIKGDGKGKKWCIKMVDAKFKLPRRDKEDSEETRLKQRFVNLEGLDYAEEHDDITVGFDNEQGMSAV